MDAAVNKIENDRLFRVSFTVILPKVRLPLNRVNFWLQHGGPLPCACVLAALSVCAIG